MIDLVKFRRDLHQNPETGLDLHRTSQQVATVLEAAGLSVTRNVGQTGLVATLARGNDDTAFGLRADMDALPITEANTFAHRSLNEGKFHGCGHDGHTTMLVGAALAMATDPDFSRTVHFVFQPDEENGTGAQAMINDGLFERFPMRAIFGMHNMPGMEIGQFATQDGPFCAFEDNFEINITGQGGHSSMPEIGIDPIVVASAIVSQLQTIVSRSVSAGDHAVVSVTEFKTDGARNILASNVTLSGDCRGFHTETSKQIEARMRSIVAGVCAAHNARAKVDYQTSFMPLVNETNCTKIAVSAAANVGKINDSYGRVGFSEDFAAFLQHRPGAFILMGNGTDDACAMPLHNPSYDFNDSAIELGVQYWYEIARHG